MKHRALHAFIIAGLILAMLTAVLVACGVTHRPPLRPLIVQPPLVPGAPVVPGGAPALGPVIGDDGSGTPSWPTPAWPSFPSLNNPQPVAPVQPSDPGPIWVNGAGDVPAVAPAAPVAPCASAQLVCLDVAHGVVVLAL